MEFLSDRVVATSVVHARYAVLLVVTTVAVVWSVLSTPESLAGVWLALLGAPRSLVWLWLPHPEPFLLDILLLLVLALRQVALVHRLGALLLSRVTKRWTAHRPSR